MYGVNESIVTFNCKKTCTCKKVNETLIPKCNPLCEIMAHPKCNPQSEIIEKIMSS